MSDSKKRVLILGGGFGGVYVAVHLGKLLSKKEREEIEIVWSTGRITSFSSRSCLKSFQDRSH
jgi:NADH dehydrogenase, FAD-containing subunit